jgi:excisionase family DNA binding protein
MEDDHLISIASAADRFNVSRRTIERWIRDGRLAAEVSKRDRRVRFVDPDDVQALVTQRVRPKVNREGNLNQPGAGATKNGCEELDYQDVIDMTLQLVYSHDHRLICQLYPPAFDPLTLSQLREGALGQHLKSLVDLAREERRIPKKRALAATETILQLLFWPAAADDYSVPWSFWDTDLGRMLSRIKRQAYRPNELMTIEEAAEAFGVSRLTVYRWIRNGTLDFVRNDVTGRPFVVRHDVAHLKRVAAEFSV